MEISIIAKNAKRLRINLEMTQAQVAEKSGISVPTYSNIESAKTSPRVDTLYKVASALGVGIGELFVQIRELRAVRFRAQKRMKRRDQVLARAATWLSDFNSLLKEGGEKHKYTLSGLPVKLKKISPDEKPLEAAKLARGKMGLDANEPIRDIAGLFAAHGIKVLAYSLKSDAFFGMSIGESEGGPAIVVNVWDRIPVERWIFSAAHELGHLLLHLHAYNVDSIEENKEQEKDANAFASEFLMPHEGFKKEWSETAGLDTWDRILKVKRIYHVSYKAVIFRLIELGKLKEDVWKRLNMFLKQQYPKQEITKSFEPEKLREYDFVTVWLERLVRVAYENEIISKSRGCEILDISSGEMRRRANSWARERSGNSAI